MFTTDTLVQALEAGLTGGASGALGGAVGTGLSRMNAGDSSLRGNVERYAAQDEYEQALKEHKRREELAREPGEVDGEEPFSQRSGADSSPTEGSPWQDGQSVLDEQSTMERKAAGHAEEGSGSGTTADRGAAFEAARQVLNDPDAARNAAFAEPGDVIAAGNAANAESNANDTAVENPGENVENALRETYGMEAPRTEGQKQARTEQVLRSWKVGEKAAQEISRKQPEGVDSDRYAAAASTLYRAGPDGGREEL